MFYLSVVSFAFCAPFAALFHFYAAREDKRAGKITSKAHMAAAQVFIFCLLAVFNITGVPDAYSLRWGGSSVNLVPFDVFRTNYLQYFQNVWLFMPAGFLLPAAWDRYKNPLRVALTGLALSLAVETAQLFSHRAFDVDDLMMNTLGAFLGAVVFKAARAVFPKIAACSAGREPPWRFEPAVCFMIAGAFMFFGRPVIENLL